MLLAHVGAAVGTDITRAMASMPSSSSSFSVSGDFSMDSVGEDPAGCRSRI